MPQPTKGAGMLRRAVRSQAFTGILGGRHMDCAYYFVDGTWNVPTTLTYRIDDSDCVAVAAINVFFRSIAMVSGPMPPGTGVIALAILDTLSKSTSPTIRSPS